MKQKFPDLFIHSDGWCQQAVHCPSPNCDARPDGAHANLLVIHNISLPPGHFGEPWIIDLFLNCLDYDAHQYFNQLRSLRVSAHFLIRRNGELIQFVSANDRAWHAGLSSFNGRDRCNDYSIGVELEGTDYGPFTEDQYRILAALTRALQIGYPLTDVVGHEHISPIRKTDPGPYFDWAHYRSNFAEAGAAMPSTLRFASTLATD